MIHDRSGCESKSERENQKEGNNMRRCVREVIIQTQFIILSENALSEEKLTQFICCQCTYLNPTYCSTFHLLQDGIINAILHTELLSITHRHTDRHTHFSCQLVLMLALPYRLQAMLGWLVGLSCIWPWSLCVCACVCTHSYGCKIMKLPPEPSQLNEPCFAFST